MSFGFFVVINLRSADRYAGGEDVGIGGHDLDVGAEGFAPLHAIGREFLDPAGDDVVGLGDQGGRGVVVDDLHQVERGLGGEDAGAENLELETFMGQRWRESRAITRPSSVNLNLCGDFSELVRIRAVTDLPVAHAFERADDVLAPDFCVMLATAGAAR